MQTAQSGGVWGTGKDYGNPRAANHLTTKSPREKKSELLEVCLLRPVGPGPVDTGAEAFRHHSMGIFNYKGPAASHESEDIFCSVQSTEYTALI